MHEEPVLVLDGPEEVRVFELGPVDGPVLKLSDGSQPSDLHFYVGRRNVAAVGDGIVVARGPGQTPITAKWRGQGVTWTLFVDLVTELHVSGPSHLRPGDVAQLDLEAVRLGQPVAVGEVRWTSSDPSVLVVREGRVQAIRPGRAYVTAQTMAASAMVELVVVNDR